MRGRSKIRRSIANHSNIRDIGGSKLKVGNCKMESVEGQM